MFVSFSHSHIHTISSSFYHLPLSLSFSLTHSHTPIFLIPSLTYPKTSHKHSQPTHKFLLTFSMCRSRNSLTLSFPFSWPFLLFSFCILLWFQSSYHPSHWSFALVIQIFQTHFFISREVHQIILSSTHSHSRLGNNTTSQSFIYLCSADIGSPLLLTLPPRLC